MTQEDKELLLKELSTRMPYGLKVNCKLKDEDYLFTFDEKHMGVGALYTDYYGNPLESPNIILSGCYYGDDIKPYLFPLSSMTEEQRIELYKVLGWGYESHYHLSKEWEAFNDSIDNNDLFLPVSWVSDLNKMYNWLNKNHFDYRELIPLGLALDATGLNIY